MVVLKPLLGLLGLGFDVLSKSSAEDNLAGSYLMDVEFDARSPILVEESQLALEDVQLRQT